MDRIYAHAYTLHLFIELLYGGYWEVQQRKESVVGDSEHQHLFALTFVLQPNWDEFDHLTKCLDSLQSKWPRTEPREGIIQHFYFEANNKKILC